MMRAPMSRMANLTEKELKNELDNSRLAIKYNDTVDRESAYELLNKKIEIAYKESDREQKEKERAKKRKTTARKSTRMNPVLKVVTSATFIRGVLGILKRVMK